MKIIHLIPGTGSGFYCQNCIRDIALVRALRRLGHDVVIVPLYLPISTDPADLAGATPVFFGAVGLYLRERLPFLRRSPNWVGRMLDSPRLLNWAARKAGSTRASGLEAMTLSMLRGEHGRQARELSELVAWLTREGRPDVVHLSNALLLGLAPRLQEALGAPVVCTLQDEDVWIAPMSPEVAQQIWDTMAEKARHVAVFTAVSQYYAERMAPRLRLAPGQMRTIHIGIDLGGCTSAPLTFNPPVIGYLSRLAESLGFGILIEAFLKLKSNPRLRDLRLRATGGQTADDRHFLQRLRARLVAAGCWQDLEILSDFGGEARLEFLRSLSVLSVPVPGGEAFGTYQIEAMACGVPVVQPRLGAFPEIINQTGGGILYEPNDPVHLAAALEELLLDPARARQYANAGRAAVFANFGVQLMAEKMSRLYAEFATGKAT